MAKQKKQGKRDMQAIMEVYTKLATPGEPHKLLAGMAGSWNACAKFWMEPNTPPLESSGTCEQKMVLGGRFLQQHFTGEIMGSTFTGIGFTGYDNHIRKYVSTWIDSMATGILCFKGTSSADGKTIVQKSRYDDPIKGPMKAHSVTQIVDSNTVVFELYGTDKRGNLEKMLEITYSRKQ